MKLTLTWRNCFAVRCVSQGNTVAKTVAMSIQQIELSCNLFISNNARVAEWQTLQT